MLLFVPCMYSVEALLTDILVNRQLSINVHLRKTLNYFSQLPYKLCIFKFQQVASSSHLVFCVLRMSAHESFTAFSEMCIILCLYTSLQCTMLQNGHDSFFFISLHTARSIDLDSSYPTETKLFNFFLMKIIFLRLLLHYMCACLSIIIVTNRHPVSCE